MLLCLERISSSDEASSRVVGASIALPCCRASERRSAATARRRLPGRGETAFPHRSSGHNFLIISEWMTPKISDRCIAWARETYAAMAPFVAPGRYVNYLGDDESDDPVAAAYGRNYGRLQRIKAKYDPNNFFHMNQNIRPMT